MSVHSLALGNRTGSHAPSQIHKRSSLKLSWPVHLFTLAPLNPWPHIFHAAHHAERNRAKFDYQSFYASQEASRIPFLTASWGGRPQRTLSLAPGGVTSFDMMTSALRSYEPLKPRQGGHTRVHWGSYYVTHVYLDH